RHRRRLQGRRGISGKPDQGTRAAGGAEPLTAADSVRLRQARPARIAAPGLHQLANLVRVLRSQIPGFATILDQIEQLPLPWRVQAGRAAVRDEAWTQIPVTLTAF